MATPTFDATVYKQTTREQWQDAAEAWHRWDPTFEDWLGPATERMLDLTEVGEGTRVLDVAAGSGGQTLAAAHRGATVLATDISEAILAYAAAEARRAGLERVATRVLDGEALDVEPGTFDAVISRLGIMYFPDKPRALAEQHRALRPGGRFGAIVFAEAEANGFFSVPIGIIRRRAELPPPAPGLPGPFSATGIGAQLDDAGFHDVSVERVAAPLRLSSAVECTRLERESFGALHQMLAGLDAAGQAEAWAEIEEALGQFEGPEGFVGPCELLVATATA
ncbi:MAG TPA: class I SAM-dependent methyltransferase [Gaiellaceae bacterium]|jgi:SAM-dependent methyltransferase|nr:class I SAM-dependent methyltransferase [Gaiellaceae bacterium]